MEERKLSEGICIITGEGICSNVYALRSGKKTLLIDTGDGSLKLPEPEIVILTHGHFDHANGVKESWKVFLREEDMQRGKDAMNAPRNAQKLDFKELKFGEFELEIIHTPGHTSGSVCVFEKKSRILFSGDTKFAYGGVGRTDFGGNEEELEKSLEKIARIPYKLLCPGHGETEERE
ncbi:MAG: MBL fold metallo-hydrolase [Candidatus Micrarchaeota archaeon]